MPISSRKLRRYGRAWRRIIPLSMATSGRLSPPRILFLPSTAYTSGRTPKRRTFLSPTFTRSTSSDSTNSFPGCTHTWKRRPNTHKRRGSAACFATTRECQKLGSGFGKDAFVVALAGGDEVAGAEGFFGADFPPLNDELRYAVPGEH